MSMNRSKMPRRIVVVGGPRVGKTTYAKEFSWPARCSDPKSLGGDANDRTDLPQKERWSAVSAEVATWFDAVGPWVIEGVAVPRALRKWRKNHPLMSCPVDEVYILSTPQVELTPGQAAMAKSVQTVLNEIMPWLEATARIIRIRG